MGNRITGIDGMDLKLSNGSTDVLFDVLTLSGCALARTPWEQHLVLYFADGHRLARGCAGFDLLEMPWSDERRSERAFFVRMIDLAHQRHGWPLLNYQPVGVDASLSRLRSLVAGFVCETPSRGDWRVAPDPAALVRCPRHDIYRGQLGCRLDDVHDIAPLGAAGACGQDVPEGD